MAVRRLLPLLAILLAAAPAGAEEAPAPSSEGGNVLELLEDVVDGVGGVLKVLVGPPISSPSRYMSLPGAGYPEDPPRPAGNDKPAAETKPAPAVLPPPTPVQPVAESEPEPVRTPAPPLPLVDTPAQPIVLIPPPPRPVPPQPQAKPPVPPAPQTSASAVTAPPCASRLAATATRDQAARLPRCQ